MDGIILLLVVFLGNVLSYLAIQGIKTYAKRRLEKKVAEFNKTMKQEDYE